MEIDERIETWCGQVRACRVSWGTKKRSRDQAAGDRDMSRQIVVR